MHASMRWFACVCLFGLVVSECSGFASLFVTLFVYLTVCVALFDGVLAYVGAFVRAFVCWFVKLFGSWLVRLLVRRLILSRSCVSLLAVFYAFALLVVVALCVATSNSDFSPGIICRYV